MTFLVLVLPRLPPRGSHIGRRSLGETRRCGFAIEGRARLSLPLEGREKPTSLTNRKVIGFAVYSAETLADDPKKTANAHVVQPLRDTLGEHVGELRRQALLVTPGFELPTQLTLGEHFLDSTSETQGAKSAEHRPAISLSSEGSDTPRSREARFARAWRVWLAALAHDPEAALAAASTYRSLDLPGRTAWVDALEADASEVDAPAIALYAPLLSVEEDEALRERIEQAITCAALSSPPPLAIRTLCSKRHGNGSGSNGIREASATRRLLVLIHPLYLNFVEVLVCVIHPEGTFLDVRHDPIRRDRDAPRAGETLDGVELESVPLEPAIEELAHAVVAHRRALGTVPEPLSRFVDLFSPAAESMRRV